MRLSRRVQEEKLFKSHCQASYGLPCLRSPCAHASSSSSLCTCAEQSQDMIRSFDFLHQPSAPGCNTWRLSQ
eukprot:216608-Amphidinium_carterae.1